MKDLPLPHLLVEQSSFASPQYRQQISRQQRSCQIRQRFDSAQREQ
jgi:hypothetical protein